MKPYSNMKARGPSRLNPQQVTFELKHRVIFALNKLADRDTYQIAVEELDKMAECLTPDKIAPFVSCVLDTDSEQKSAVRKECIRLMGVVAMFHQGLVGPHLNKMVASIVKRLKDSDSVVRDACVETMGVLASKLGQLGDDNDGVFVVLVRPLFEALAEQNKLVQSGAALCLASVINNTQNPPVSIIHRMLTRVIKMLKNPHFMAKPAVIELNLSIIQAGGAATHSVLAAAMASIQEALKSNDWTTRKAASLALMEIASSGRPYFGNFKASSIRSLESCRFDKVKPVRETVLQALQCWKGLPGPDSPQPSEAGSSIKDVVTDACYSNLSRDPENRLGGHSSGLMSPTNTRKDVTAKKVLTDTTKRRMPLSVKKTCQNYIGKSQNPHADDWHIEVAVPKGHNVMSDFHNEESEGSCITKTLERMSTDGTRIQDMEYEFVRMDDAQEYSSVSNLATENFESKVVTVSPECLEEDDLPQPVGRNQFCRTQDASLEERAYPSKMQDRQSLDSTVTESSSHTVRGCCLQMENEVSCIRKHLAEIENKQSNMMDMLQVFSTSVMDSLSILQSKVLSLEHVVEGIAQQGGRYSDFVSSKLIKQNQTLVSPRVSTCSSRSSVDVRNKQLSPFSGKNSEIWEDKFSRSISRSANESAEIWSNPTAKSSRKSMGKDIDKSSGMGAQSVNQVRKTKAISYCKLNNSESKNNLWQCVMGHLCEGDLDSAYMEALYAGNELVLVELLDRTGPVLEKLSSKMASDLLTALTAYLSEQRFMNSIIPWLQQVVDLSTTQRSNHLVVSAKARREFLSAIQDASKMELPNLAEKRLMKKLAMKLCQAWGDCC